MNMDSITAEVRSYGTYLRSLESPKRKDEYLSRIGAQNQTNHALSSLLLKRLMSDIQSQKALSLIRLGDGEGNILFWGLRKHQYPELAKFGMDKIWKIMFGTKGDSTQYDRVYKLLVSGIYASDYVGIAESDGDERSIGLVCDSPTEMFDIRGHVGATAVWDWLYERIDTELEIDRATFINAWFHNSMTPDRLRGIIDLVNKVSVITCYPKLLDRFVCTFGVTPGVAYSIPPQYSVAEATPETIHFPDRFVEIAAELADRDLSGELFLVGAGIIGKVYCDLVKKQGGMAIDVGSMMDVWMGVRARMYQDSEFLDLHRL